MSFRYSEPTRAVIGYSDEPVLERLWTGRDRFRNLDIAIIKLDHLERCSSLYIGVDRDCLVIHTDLDGTIVLRSGIPVFSRAFLRAKNGAAAVNVGRFMEAFVFWTESARKGALIINRPISGGGSNKISHLTELMKAGFEVPSAIVSLDPKRLQLHAEPKISKGISSVRTIASRDCRRELYLSSGSLSCPALVQDYVEGYDVRAHVVGTECFALKIVTNADDYRYARQSGADIRFEEIELPASIRSLCWHYLKAARLEFGGFDFKVDADGRYWVLECNSMPGYAFFDKYHNGRITDAIYRYLELGYSSVHWNDGWNRTVIPDSRQPKLNTG